MTLLREGGTYKTRCGHRTGLRVERNTDPNTLREFPWRSVNGEHGCIYRDDGGYFDSGTSPYDLVELDESEEPKPGTWLSEKGVYRFRDGSQRGLRVVPRYGTTPYYPWKLSDASDASEYAYTNKGFFHKDESTHPYDLVPDEAYAFGVPVVTSLIRRRPRLYPK